MKTRVLLAVALIALGACSHPSASSVRIASDVPARLVVATKERWRVPLPSEHIGIPEVTPDAIYLTTADSVVALLPTGEAIWSTPFDGGTRIYAPRAADDAVLVAGETALMALRRSTGEVTWRFEAGERTNRPAVTNGVVVATTAGGRVIGLDLATGALRWDTSMATQSGAQVAMAEGIAVVVGIAEWAGFDVTDGRRVWSGDLGLLGTSSPAIVATPKESLAVVATENKLIAVGLHDGQLRWEARAGQSELAQVPTVAEGELLVPDHWGRLGAYRPVDGTLLWEAKGADGVSLWGEPVSLGRQTVALALTKDGPRIASPRGALALRPPSPGLGVARLPDGGLVVSTWGKGQNYLVAYDLDLGG